MMWLEIFHPQSGHAHVPSFYPFLCSVEWHKDGCLKESERDNETKVLVKLSTNRFNEKNLSLCYELQESMVMGGHDCLHMLWQTMG